MNLRMTDELFKWCVGNSPVSLLTELPKVGEVFLKIDSLMMYVGTEVYDVPFEFILRAVEKDDHQL